MKVRLTESQLKDIVVECVKNILKEEEGKKLPIQIVGGHLEGLYDQDTFEKEHANLIEGYVTPEQYPHLTPKLHGYPLLKGLIGPMFNGDNIRYETQEVYDVLSM